MVNIIENKAKVKGKVKTITENTSLQGYCQIKLQLQKSDEVKGYPNLAKADEGTLITINIRSSEIENQNIKPGSDFSATVKKVFGQKYFIDSASK
jgi:hypothetical protein